MKGIIKHQTQSQQELQRQAFERLEDVPPEIEWFANIQNKHTRRAYLTDVQQFQQFLGIMQLEDFRDVTRAHVIAFRDYLQRQDMSQLLLGATFQHYLPCLTTYAMLTPFDTILALA